MKEQAPKKGTGNTKKEKKNDDMLTGYWKGGIRKAEAIHTSLSLYLSLCYNYRSVAKRKKRSLNLNSRIIMIFLRPPVHCVGLLLVDVFHWYDHGSRVVMAKLQITVFNWRLLTGCHKSIVVVCTFISIPKFVAFRRRQLSDLMTLQPWQLHHQ